MATIQIGNSYRVDIIKNIQQKYYKVRPYNIVHGKKQIIENKWQDYGTFPIFHGKVGRDSLIDFLNGIIEDEEHEPEQKDLDFSILEE